MFRLLVLSGLLATALGESIVSQCIQSNGVLPTSFEIDGCSSSPCILHQGEDAVIKVKFNAPNASKSLTSALVMFLQVGQIQLPIAVDLGSRAEVCSVLDSGCPVSAGQELEYSVSVPIESFYPAGLSSSFELRVVDDSDSPALCARSSLVFALPRM